MGDVQSGAGHEAEPRDAGSESLGERKAELRRALGARRRQMSDTERDAARVGVRAAVLREVDAAGWRCVAAYEPLRSEPGSTELLAALVERGVRVLVPVTLPDRDLDWAWWTPDGREDPSGLDTIGAADLVVAPALAVADDGTRLGRGGGSYDRALSRRRPGVRAAALLFDGERVPTLPAQPWDVPVEIAVGPSGWQELRPPQPRNTGVAPGR